MFHKILVLIPVLVLTQVSSQNRRQDGRVSLAHCNEPDIPIAESLARVIVSARVDRVLDERSVQVAIRRVLKGDAHLVGSIKIVEGLRPECDALRTGDIRYFFVKSDRPGVMISLRQPLSVTLDNIDRLQAAISKQPLARRPPFSELPCETKYCPNNQECHEHQGQASCRCPDSCPYDPDAKAVCGSNNATYPSHCRLRVDSCRRSERVWVLWVGPCDSPRNAHIHPFEMSFTSY